MNIFLPYEKDVIKSVSVLDNSRLIKQILEVKQLLLNAIKESYGETPKGYANHPVYKFYKDNIAFLCYYGYISCQEYQYRFGKEHELFCEFSSLFMNKFYEYIDPHIYKLKQPPYTPYYMEGSKGQPNCIRTITDVEILFQSKLISKWQNDKKQPKWSNRKTPIFYKNYINLSENDKNKYWEYILNIKRKHYGKS